MLKCYVKREQHEMLNCKVFKEAVVHFDDVVILCALREGLESRLSVSKSALNMETDESQEYINNEIKTLEGYLRDIDNEITLENFKLNCKES
jgi:hypothetical protein